MNDPPADGGRRWALIRRALDRERVRDRLNACMDWPEGTRVAAVKVRRFMPGRRSRLDVEYDLLLQRRHNGCVHLRRATLYARSVSGANDIAVPETSGAQPLLSDEGLSQVSVLDPDLGLALHSPDRDPVLSQYACCVDEDRMADRLAEIGLIPRGPRPRDTDRGILHCERIAFRFGRRFVIRYTHHTRRGDLRWAGKCYADERGERLAGVHRQLYEQLISITGGRIRLPRLIHYDDELRMVLTVWNAAEQDSRSRSPEDQARAAAESLAAIQASSPKALQDVGPLEQWPVLVRWHDCIAHLLPKLARRAAAMMDALGAARDTLPAEQRRVIHRDFYEAQLIVNGDGATVLDLDTLAVGDRAEDVGNYLAHQWLWCLERGLGLGCYRAIACTMLEAYERATAPLNERALAFHWASSLFRVGAIHAFRDNTARYTGRLWDLVHPVLSHGRRALETPPPSDVSMAVPISGKVNR